MITFYIAGPLWREIPTGAAQELTVCLPEEEAHSLGKYLRAKTNGLKTSPAKAKASQNNGKLGGRPKKFEKLRSKMSPEAQARSNAKALELLAAMDADS